MMKKYFYYSAVLFLSVVLYQCQSPKETESAQAEAVSAAIKPDSVDKSKYPNDDSELAWLMRQMYEDGEYMKAEVQAGNLPKDFREKFKKIHHATPTDASVKGEVFDAAATAFLKAMDNFYEHPENQIESFNILVNTCIACHQNHCPGPIKRIKKLTIQ